MDWLSYRRSPEQIYIVRENSEKYIRRLVWKVLNNMPKSVRNDFYKTLPGYIADRVQTRVEHIEAGIAKKRKAL